MAHLTKREKTLAFVTTGIILVWTVFMFVVNPAVERIKTLSRVVPQKNKELALLKKKSAEYLKLKAQIDRARNQAETTENLNPLTFLEQTTTQLGFNQNVKNLKKSTVASSSDFTEVIIELEIEKITLNQLLDLLLQIKKTDSMLFTKNLFIQKNTADSNYLDVNMQISTIGSNGLS